MHGMNHFMESTTEKLSVLERWTEPFLPSKHSAVQPNLIDHHLSLLNPILPCRLFPPSSTSTLSLLPSTHGPSPISSQSVPSNSPSLSSEPLSPNTQLSLHLAQIATSNGSWHPASEFPLLRSNVLSPAMILAFNHHTYYILPLSPLVTFNQPLVHTPHDLVLPLASAWHIPSSPLLTAPGDIYLIGSKVHLPSGLHMHLVALVIMQTSNPFRKHGMREPTSRMLATNQSWGWLMWGGEI